MGRAPKGSTGDPKGPNRGEKGSPRGQREPYTVQKGGVRTLKNSEKRETVIKFQGSGIFTLQTSPELQNQSLVVAKWHPRGGGKAVKSPEISEGAPEISGNLRNSGMILP